MAYAGKGELEDGEICDDPLLKTKMSEDANDANEHVTAITAVTVDESSNEGGWMPLLDEYITRLERVESYLGLDMNEKATLSGNAEEVSSWGHRRPPWKFIHRDKMIPCIVEAVEIGGRYGASIDQIKKHLSVTLGMKFKNSQHYCKKLNTIIKECIGKGLIHHNVDEKLYVIK